MRLIEKVMVLVTIMLMSSWLYSSTIRTDISNVYYNQGLITATMLNQGLMGLSYTRAFSPAVYCCGSQTLYWDNFPLEYPARIYVKAKQKGALL